MKKKKKICYFILRVYSIFFHLDNVIFAYSARFAGRLAK